MTDYDDAYATCAATYSSLRIFSDTISAEQISRRLSIQPTRTHAVGDPISARVYRPRTTHGWLLETRGVVDSRDSRRHIDWLLDQLIPAEAELHNLRAEGADANIFSYWVSARGHGGPMISPPQMEKLARLRLDCGWDVYLGDREAV